MILTTMILTVITLSRERRDSIGVKTTGAERIDIYAEQ